VTADERDLVLRGKGDVGLDAPVRADFAQVNGRYFPARGRNLFITVGWRRE